MKIQHEVHDLIMVFRPETKYNYKGINFHWHENAEFLYVLGDGLKALIDGIMYEPKKGDLIFIAAHTPHYFLCDEDIYISLGQLSLSLLLDGGTKLKPVKPHITAEEIARDPVFENQLMHLLEIMKSIGNVTKDDKNCFAKSIFSAFYFILMEKFPETNQNSNSKKERNDFYKIINFINENLTNDITVVSISKSLYIGRGTLARIFLKYSGMSVNDYINKLRVSKANEFLEKGYSVTNAAYESGFQSIRTFNNVYKNLMGIKPSQYTNKTGRD